MERNVPKLRFKGFNDEWRETTFKNIFNNFEYGMNSAAIEFDGKNKYIRITDIDESSNKYSKDNMVSPDGILEDKFLVKENDILFARTGASVGKTYLYNIEDGKLYFAGFLIRGNVKKEHDSRFIFMETQTENYRKWVNIISMRSGQPGINSQEYSSYNLKVPSLEEQERIANFLTKVDKIIEKQEEKVKNLEKYKKGMMQKIFSQEIRFKDENGEEYPEWEEKKLSEILIERKEKNYGELRVCSVAVKKGIVDQIQHLGRSFAAKDTSNYKVVKLGDVVYTKSPTGEFPFGIIKQSFLDEDVVVSPLYGVFEPINISVGYILHNYFNYKENTNNYLYSIIQKGAKNTINISNETFLSKTLKIPVARNEQIKISNLLHNINSIIDKENNKLEKLKQWKKGLLQQMFV